MKIILTLMLLTWSLFARADLDNYAHKLGFERNYYTALKQAKKLHRPLMLVITKPECPWCDRFEDHTLNDTAVLKRLKKEVVVVLVYKDFDDDVYPAQLFPTPFSPRTFFVNPFIQHILHVINGYVPKKDFFHELDIVKTGWNK